MAESWRVSHVRRRSILVAGLLYVTTTPAWALTSSGVTSGARYTLSSRTTTTSLHVAEPKKPDMATIDLTGGRPGAIIETEEQLERKAEIFQEIEDGVRQYPSWIDEYGDPEEEEDDLYDRDDPDAVDSSKLGTYDIFDLKSKFDYEWDPDEGDPDPNVLSDEYDYVTVPEKDEDGIEVGWDPVFGPSNPVDTRTITTPIDSYMIAEDTRDDSILEPVFPEGDLEVGYNEDVVKFRKSLGIIETYIDPYLPDDLPVPRHVAKWHGYPERLAYPEKSYKNNRFTKEEDMTDFDSLTPFRARQRAVELARSKNSEWLPVGKSAAWHEKQRAPYEKHGTLVGTLRKGECDEDLVQEVQPVLDILGSVADLLEIIDRKIYRFHYHGLIKNRHGMAAWTKSLIRDAGVECTNVIFETGFRKRDPYYDGGDPWFGPY